jgi:hypothetical protein
MSDVIITVEGSGLEADVKIDTWLKDLLARTPNAVRKVVRREFLLACRQFFEESRAWRVVIGPKDCRANKENYILSPYDAYADVVSVISVEFNGSPLATFPRRPSDVTQEGATPSGYWLEAPDRVRLWPTPTQTTEDALTFYVALKPKESVTHLPKIAATHLYDALLDGALSRLYAHPAKAYTNPPLAQYHAQKFRGAIGNFSAQGKSGFSGAQTWSFPRFGK